MLRPPSEYGEFVELFSAQAIADRVGAMGREIAALADFTPFRKGG